jgi:hypothetical protein
MCEQRLTNTAERLLELLKRAQATKDRDAEFEILIRLRKIGHAAPEYEAKAVLRFVPKAGVDAEEQLMKLLPKRCLISDFVRDEKGDFILKVRAADPKYAAEHANHLAEFLKVAMTLEAQGTLPPVEIVTRLSHQFGK